jgi:hypothetical protein
MRASRCVLFVTRTLILALTSILALALLFSVALAQQSDQAVAEHVLGPQWKQLSRRAGMIFAGTVLAPSTHPVADETLATDRIAMGTNAVGTTAMGANAAETTPGIALPVQFSFHVDEAIAGVERGQVLAIREWAGALTRQRPMRLGERFLLFLYPPGRLGLTSPVAGAQGQVALDTSGKNISDDWVPLGNTPEKRRVGININVLQLERAIRRARSE